MQSSQFYASIILFLSNSLLSHQNHESTSPLLVYQSRLPTVRFPSETVKNQYISQGRYVQRNILLLDTEFYGALNRYFMTAPIFRQYGIPASLYELNVTTGLLAPFPSLPTYVNSSSVSCSSIVAVFRTALDDCGRLWVLDSGRNESVVPGYQHCPPKLLIYDLKNKDREILRYEIPYGVYTDRSRLGSIIVESRNSDCSGSFAYLLDTNDYAIIVFDYANKNSWRIQHKYFYPFPTEMTIYVNYSAFISDNTDGVFSGALGPKSESSRKLYYHSFASVRESWAPISVLKNQSAANYPPVTRKAYALSPGKRSGVSSVEVMTADGILIYGLVEKNQMACWNSKTPFTLENQHVIKTDNQRFQFISGLKLYKNVLVITSCRFQSFATGSEVNQTDANYRVMVVNDVNSWLKDTPCVTKTSNKTSYWYPMHGHK